MANTTVIKRDPANKQLVLEVVDETGAVVATAGRIILSLDAVAGATSGYREATFREFKWKDYDAGCIEKKAYFLMTEPVNV